MAAAGWSITTNSENTEYTHKWAIKNFDFAMEVGEGKVESSKFSIPGVPGEFQMVVELEKKYWATSKCYQQMPTRIKIRDQQEFGVKFFFSVSLKSTAEGIKAVGKLDVIKEGTDTLSGEFGDSINHKFVPPQSFVPDFELKYHDNNCYGGFTNGRGFYTTGNTCLLNLVARITTPGKLASLGGKEEEEGMKQGRLLDFKPLLSDPKHSDIVLKCGDTRFLCHKVILAVR